MKSTLIKGILLGAACAWMTSETVKAQAFTENFDDITLLAGNGWTMTNASTPLGVTNWSQGPSTAGGGPFDAFNGAAAAYISANYNNTTGGSGIISNWLLTPNRTFRNGDVITFYTRKASPDNFPDRLEVRLSTNGTSATVGTGAGVGDYTTLLLSVNPTLVTGVYPTVWTQYTITLSGLPAPTSGRIGFRYHVTGAGPSGANSDFIGIDNIVYTPYVCPAFTMTASGALAGGTAGSAYSTTLTQTGALGAPNYAVTAGALPPGLTLSAGGTISGTPTATGTFNFTVTVSDASGCTGSSSYSITVVCPANPISFAPIPALCDNAGVYSLTEASPAGGTYSGTGVSGGNFDPAAGTQTITYDITDLYGCPHSQNATITVNAAPTATLTPFTAVCEDAAPVTLSGGMPAGGVYSGTGVTAGNFDPASGTQMITYTYTDANGCMDDVSESFQVNALPVVTLSSFSAVCDNGGVVSLAGGAPAGGTYSGTGVTGTNFDPASGTQTITYSYTDGNGCSNSAMEVMTVNAAPTVSLTLPVTEVCVTHAAVALSGGTPAGGNYSGTGVAGGNFDPATAGVGSHVVTYAYTDGNGCSDQSTATILVGDCAGVEEESSAPFTVYPNPSSDVFTISGNNIDLTVLPLVVDLSGREVNALAQSNGSEWKIDLSGKPEGVYFVSVLSNGKQFRVKLEKIK